MILNTEKIIGYILLVIGMGIILVSAFSVYQVFTGQKTPPRVVSFEAPSFTLPGQQAFEIELPEGMKLPEGVSLPQTSVSQGKSQELKILPDEMINSVSNLSFHFLLMGFLASVGAKIASIGTKMVKEIKVVIKEEKIRQAIQSSSQPSSQT